jgi:hypothetical protein
MPHTPRRRNDRQPHRLPRTGKPALKTSTTNIVTQAESSTSNFDLPALNSMRRTASPSRPYGRYAVGLRPSLDPDAYFGVPSQDKEARRTNQNTTEMGLDGPRSFRNDQRILSAARRR